MTNATKFEKEDFQIYLTERAVPTVASSAGTIELHHKVAQDKAGVYMITVGNLTLDTATGAGKFTLANDPTEDKCTLTFDVGDCDGTEFEVNYAYEQNVEVANITNKNTAIGEAVLKYPVYNDGSDCTDAGIAGYVVMKVFRARVTQQPGMNGSYKQASTFDFTLSAMDAHRNDEAVYAIAYLRQSKEIED